MKPLLLIFTVSILSSCLHTKRFEEGLQATKYPILYSPGTVNSQCKLGDTIQLSYKNNAFPEATKLERKNYFILPLVLFNYAKRDWKVTLGESSFLNSSYRNFVTQSVQKEVERTGCAVRTENRTSPRYQLEITITECSTVAVYKRKAYMLIIKHIGDAGSWDICTDATTIVKMKARLTDNGKIILEKEYAETHTEPYINEHRKKTNSGNEPLFIKNMTNSLTIASQRCIDRIVTDINDLK